MEEVIDASESDTSLIDIESKSEPNTPIASSKSSENNATPATKKVHEKITIGEDKDEIEKRKAKRKERFGIKDEESVESKKLKRAEKFGSSTANGATISTPTPVTEEKKQARASRFGLITSPQEDLSSNGKSDKISASSGGMTPEEKKKLRASRFAKSLPPDIEEKRNLRASRFGLTTPEVVEEKLKARANRFN